MGKHDEMLFEHVPQKRGNKKPVKIRASKPVPTDTVTAAQLLKYVIVAIIVIAVGGLLAKMYIFKIDKIAQSEITTPAQLPQLQPPAQASESLSETITATSEEPVTAPTSNRTESLPEEESGEKEPIEELVINDSDVPPEFSEINTSACDNIEAAFKPNCIVNVIFTIAVEKDDISFCNLLGEPKDCKDNFLKEKGIMLLDKRYCDKITHYRMKQECLSTYAFSKVRQEQDTTYCEILGDKRLKEECLSLK